MNLLFVFLLSVAQVTHSPKYALRLLICALFVMSVVTASYAQTKIEITDPKVSGNAVFLTQGAVDLTVAVTGNVKRIRVLVSQINDAKIVLNSRTQEFDVDPNKKEQTVTVNVFKGTNNIHLLGFPGNESDPDPSINASIAVTCSKKCGAGAGSDVGAGGGGGGGGQPAPPKTPGNIAILQPTGGTVDNGLVPAVISVQKSDIQTVFVKVVNNGKPIEQDKNVTSESVKYSGGLAILTPTLRLKQGANTITAFSLDLGKEEQSSVTVTCNGGKCDNPDIPASQQKVIHINIPEAGDTVKDQAFVNSKITVDDTSIQKLFVRVLSDGKPLDKPLGDTENPISLTFNGGQAVVTPKIKIGKGRNVITVFDADKKVEDSPQASADVTCEGDKCGVVEQAKITIDWPKLKRGQTALAVSDTSSIESSVIVAKDSGITKIQYDVIHEGKPIYTSETKSVDASGGPVSVPLRLKFLKGFNTIRIYDADHPGSNTDASIAIDCSGLNCASDFDIATIVTNSQNTRIVVGLEQAGASSTSSETKPFLDFFFTNPIKFALGKSPDLVRTVEFDNGGLALSENGETKLVWVRRSKLSNGDELVSSTALNSDGTPIKDGAGNVKMAWIRKSYLPKRPVEAPRFGFWGNVRLASTPEQLTTTGVLPSSLANLVTKSGSTGNLVQSFDFLAGLEYRLFTANGTFLSLIPGIKQKTRFYIAGGVGAISPLDATQEAPKFFLIPSVNSSQRGLFERTYGVPPSHVVDGATINPTYIALVPLDRDRFLKQWFAGIRLKTLYCERDEGDRECYRFRNTFPAIFDFMVGQSESVTGGSYKTSEIVPDGSTKRRQALVFRVDAFYPLPIREASFIYFYGTAVMKIGGSTRIENFLVLEPASDSPNINAPTVYVPPIDFLKSLQSNRDYYKIGVGINLTDFFNRNKPK